MSENVVINDTTYNGVDTVALVRPDGSVATFYPDAVRYNAQTLTEAQKAQARQNIGAVAKSGLSLGRHDDGLLYLYVDGVPVGSGVELPAGGIDGYITPDKQIVFNNLPDGEYTLAYINDDGSIVPIGAMEKDSNVYYTVTNNLTQCTTNNSATQAVQGGSYSATITANSGYELKSVTVTMGGSPVTVSGGTITIANVTGNIVITAVAEVAGPAYTNQIPISTDASGNPFNGGQGWKTGYRMSLSSGNETAADGYECTGFIPAKYGDVLRVKNIDLTAENSTNIVFYDSSKNPVKAQGNNNGGQLSIFFTAESNGVYVGTISTDILSLLDNNAAFIRIGSKSITDDSILTVNQEIV